MIGSLELESLEKIDGRRMLFCLVIRQNLISNRSWSSLHIYGNERSRAYGLRHWRREHKLSDTVFFTCEIPIDLFLKTAEKSV